MAVLTHREKQILTGIGTLAVLLVLLFVFAGERNRQPETPVPAEPLQPASEDRVLESSSTDIRDVFPENFPVERGARDSAGFRFVPAGTIQEQNTLTYTSALTLQDNRAAFQSFFTDNPDFAVQNEVTEEDMYFVYAKGVGDLTVTVEEQTDGRVKVTASYLKK